MMIYDVLLVSAFITLAASSAVQRASLPCPYHRVENNPSEPLIEDEYIVSLHEDYTIDEHFQFLNRNLSESADKFVRMDSIKTYSIRIDEKTIHGRTSVLLVYRSQLNDIP